MIYTQGCAVLQTAYPGLCSDGSFRALAPLGLSPQSRYLRRLIKNFYIILKYWIIQTILILKQENNGLLQNFQVLQQPLFLSFCSANAGSLSILYSWSKQRLIVKNRLLIISYQLLTSSKIVIRLMYCAFWKNRKRVLKIFVFIEDKGYITLMIDLSRYFFTF